MDRNDIVEKWLDDIINTKHFEKLLNVASEIIYPTR